MSQLTMEKLILQNLLVNEKFTRKVLPFLKTEYFQDQTAGSLFSTISEFVQKYSNLPTREAVVISVGNNKKLTQTQFEEISGLIEELYKDPKPQDIDWLVAETEKHCKDRAVYNAILESIHIIDGKNKNKTTDALPSILSDALAVSFDTNVGHDYFVDANARYDFYHRTETKVPFDLEFFNTITNGGVTPKTLNVILAGTGVGKSLFMCHHAANCLLQNQDVLYITCEMSEERIAERIDANLLDVTMKDLHELPKDAYDKMIQRVKGNCGGRLIIKEYPTSSANVNHFRALLEELSIKRKFKPTVIFIDYLNICSSARVKMSGSVNSYIFIKAIAEEIRSLAVEYNVPIFTATQTNREGFNNTEVELTNTSESFGLPATSDLMFALISTEELEKMNQIMVKQLKNRYHEASSNKKFVVGINRAKMKLMDVPKSEQPNLSMANQTSDDDDDEDTFEPVARDWKKKSWGSNKNSDWKF